MQVTFRVGPSEIWRDLKNAILHVWGKTFLNVTYIFEGAISVEASVPQKI